MRPRLHSLLLLLLLPVGLPAGARAATLNKVVLRVNDQIATLYDYQRRRQELIQDLSRREMDEEERRRLLAQAPEIAFKDMYQDLLLESRAQQVGVEVPKSQIDSSIASMKENFGIKTEEDFRQALAQSGMTEAQLRTSLEKQLRIRDLMDREVRSKPWWTSGTGARSGRSEWPEAMPPPAPVMWSSASSMPCSCTTG
jgi:parvulin-like peptidyl-prolyl isomerase